MFFKHNPKKKYFIFGSLTTISLTLILNFTITNKLTQVDDSTEFPQNYQVLVPYVPEEIEFTGEKVPLENFDVMERIEREFIVTTYFHSATILYMKRANRWFPII